MSARIEYTVVLTDPDDGVELKVTELQGGDQTDFVRFNLQIGEHPSVNTSEVDLLAFWRHLGAFLVHHGVPLEDPWADVPTPPRPGDPDGIPT